MTGAGRRSKRAGAPAKSDLLGFQVFDYRQPLVPTKTLRRIEVAGVAVPRQGRIESESAWSVVTREAELLTIKLASTGPEHRAAFRHWREQLVDGRHRAVVQVWAPRPDTGERTRLEICDGRRRVGLGRSAWQGRRP